MPIKRRHTVKWNGRKSLKKRPTRRKRHLTYNRKPPMLKKPEVIYGKLYSTTCIHCINLIPIWDQLVTHLKKQSTGKYTEMSVESQQLASGIATINSKYLINSPMKMESPMGFPTIFRIYNGHLEYFQGERDYNTLLKWISNGKSV